jgi:hypothetical protein
MCANARCYREIIHQFVLYFREIKYYKDRSMTVCSCRYSWYGGIIPPEIEPILDQSFSYYIIISLSLLLVSSIEPGQTKSPQSGTWLI